MTIPPGQLWAIVGATGTGKSALSLDLAHALAKQGTSAEVVNADAMQFYRGMNIGTAKLLPAEQQSVPHHLFDTLNVTEEATVAWYQPLARALIDEKLSQGIDVILVGGSGLYVSSVLYDFQFQPRDEALRASLETELQAEGIASLFERLQQLDPVAAEKIDRRNGRRVVRALELHKLGQSAHGVLPDKPTLWRHNTRIIGVHTDRPELVDRLNLRVETMWADGLLDEVRELIPQGLAEGPTASRAIGYAQALAQLAGEASQEEAIAETQKLTRRYARRQVSWFKRYEEVQWVSGPNLAEVQLTA